MLDASSSQMSRDLRMFQGKTITIRESNWRCELNNQFIVDNTISYINKVVVYFTECFTILALGHSLRSNHPHAIKSIRVLYIDEIRYLDFLRSLVFCLLLYKQAS